MNSFGGEPNIELTSPYSVLGLSSDASQEEIKAAYRRLAMRWHPDKCAGDSEAEERFKLIKHAYSLLSDPARRQVYASNQNTQLIEIDEHTPWAQRAQNKRRLMVAGVVVSIAALITLIVFYLSHRENRVSSWQSHSNIAKLATSLPSEITPPAQTRVEDGSENPRRMFQDHLSLGDVMSVNEALQLPSELPAGNSVLGIQATEPFPKVAELVSNESALELEQLEIKERSRIKTLDLKSESAAAHMEVQAPAINKVERQVEQYAQLRRSLPTAASSPRSTQSSVRKGGINMPSDIFNRIDAKDWYAAGMRFLEGRDGVHQNYEQAKRYLQHAAEQNHVGAQTLLGVMYAEGIGVPRNPKESLRWYRLVRQNSEQTR